MNTDLQKKIDALQLCLVDETIYEECLKTYEEIGIDVKKFEYYKMYGDHLIPYSKEYIIRSSMKELMKRDKEKYIQFNPSFFKRVKRNWEVWTLKRKVKVLRGLTEWGQKHAKDEEG
ncbi:hypothetical protein P4278_28055 [Bacillus thuringiensis]|nr:hypothetical protein [Bacillus thuringiensis]MED2783506.1 hypothetical protein [Bacillus thuringiensis]